MKLYKKLFFISTFFLIISSVYAQINETTTVTPTTTTTVPTLTTITIIPDSCSETDGGDKPKEKGTVSGYQDGGEYSHTDECLSSLKLREYYCVGGNWTSKTYNCWDYYGSRNYCYFGVCKKMGGGGRAGKRSLTEIALVPIAIAVVVILIVFGILRFFAKKR